MSKRVAISFIPERGPILFGIYSSPWNVGQGVIDVNQSQWLPLSVTGVLMSPWNHHVCWAVQRGGPDVSGKSAPHVWTSSWKGLSLPLGVVNRWFLEFSATYHLHGDETESKTVCRWYWKGHSWGTAFAIKFLNQQVQSYSIYVILTMRL